jgi:hypothetical protein
MERYEKWSENYFIPFFLEKYVFLGKIVEKNFDLKSNFRHFYVFAFTHKLQNRSVTENRIK